MKNARARRTGWLAVISIVAAIAVMSALLPSLKWINRPFPGFFIYGNLNVAPYFLSHWSGNESGLKFLDRIVSVEEQPVADPDRLYDLVRAAPPGTEFRYEVERDGKAVRVQIPSMNFTFQDWLLSFATGLLAALGFLVIGFTPFYLRAASPAAPALFLLGGAVFFWFISNFDFMTSHYFPKEFRLFALTFTPSAGVHLALALAFGSQGIKRLRPCLYAIYGISVVLGLSYSLTFHGAPEAWRWAFRSVYGYILLAATVFLGLLALALKNPPSELEKMRLRVILAGAVLGFFLPALGAVLTSAFAWKIPYNLSLVPTLFFPLSVAYALLKYSLFELDFIVKAGLTRGALAAILLLLYVLVVSFLGVGTGIYGQDPLVPLLFSGLVVVIFNPLLRRIENAVDRYVYRKEYDTVELQSEASLLLRSLSRPQAVADKCVALVASRVGLDAATLCFRPENPAAAVVASLSVEPDAVRDLTGRLHVLWSRQFGLSRKGFSRLELISEPLYEERRAELRAIFDGLAAELILPMVFQEQIVGFLSLGKKRSAKGYDGDDFRLLCTLSDQLALALENGRLFEESERARESYRALYDASQALNQRLIEVDRQKKQFVANISHELRTPVCTILGYAEVLSDPSFAGDKNAILERVANHGQELSSIMDNLLQFSRMESGSMGALLREVKIAEVFQALATMARRLIKQRPIEFKIAIEPALTSIQTDPEKFQQILMHFLTNALKFTERGEITVGIRTVIEEGAPLAECWVADTGIGISREDQAAVFEDFRQLDGSSTRQYGGTGVGLGLCKKLAQALGGRILVESEVGKGSKFSLIIPTRGQQTALIKAA
jgi:signal transduction histidine kinase